MATRTQLLNGADFEGFESWCTLVVNAIKNHYRVSDPCVNMVNRQPGEILSDPDDDKLYHVTGASGYPCDEILTASGSCDVIMDLLGVDFYDACGGDYARIKAVNEPGLGHRLTIGLDETARSMVICDLGDVDVDLGRSPRSDPVLYVFNAAANSYSRLEYYNLQLRGGNTQLEDDNNICTLQTGRTTIRFYHLSNDIDANNAFEFISDTNIELTDTNAEQAWIYVEPKINQTSTAGYVAILVDVTETSTGDATSGAGYNALLDLRISGTTYFAVKNNGVCILSDGTDSHLFGSMQETGLGGRLTVGLDETTRVMLICDYGDAEDQDFGYSTMTHPTLFIADNAHSSYMRLVYNSLYLEGGLAAIYTWNSNLDIRARDGIHLELTQDLSIGNAFEIRSDANIELTDANAEQAWVYIEPKINQTSTAGYVAVLVNVTETNTGNATDAAGYNALLDLRVSGDTKFGIQNDGKIMTNQVNVCSGATPGTLNGEIPVYDGDGVLMGYIPVYSSIC